MNARSTGAGAPHRCPVCTVAGLPILPLRYGVAWTGDGVAEREQAPALKAPFDASAYPDLGTGSARYTPRLLRGGYLYAYDEACEEWSGYEVDDAGQLYRFDVHDGPLEGDAPPAPAMCSRTAPAVLARCIQVPDPDSAGRLWLAFTDTRWTPAVLAMHADENHRARHMRCIDVGAWARAKGGAPQPHAAPLAEVLERVAEYALPQPEPAWDNHGNARREGRTLGATTLATVRVVPRPAFDFSPYEFTAGSRGDFTGALWGAHPDDPVDQDIPPLMVALDDPVGVAAEVAALMNHRLEEFLHEPGRLRSMAVSAAITRLRADVEHQAELRAIEAVEFHNRTLTDDYIAARTGTVARTRLELRESDLARERNHAWKHGRYLAKYDEAARREWQQRHDAELAALDQAVVTPLASAHVALLRGGRLQAHLQCNYDTADLQSGAGYLGAVLSCIAGTQDKVPHAGLYAEWFEASPRERDNLLLRAFALNQDRIAGEVAAAAESIGSLKVDELPWDRLFTLYGEAARQVGTGQLDAFMATLVEQTLGPAARTLSKVVDGVPKLYGLAAWGMAADLPLAWIPAEGTSDEIVRAVMLGFQRELGFRRGAPSVRAELRRLQIYGAGPRQRVRTGFVGLQRDGRLTTPVALEAARRDFLDDKLLRWRVTMDTSVRTGIGASLLSSLALFQLYRDATSGMRHQRTESWARFGVAATGTVAAALEASGTAMENFANLSPRYARYTRLWRYVRFGGRVAGAVAGAAASIMDIRQGRQEQREENYAVALAYYAAGAAGFVLAIAIFSGALFVAALALLTVLLASFFLWAQEDGPRHDWLERCLWGNLATQRYPDLEVEMDEYRIALGAA